jgi:hypothetical protein
VAHQAALMMLAVVAVPEAAHVAALAVATVAVAGMARLFGMRPPRPSQQDEASFGSEPHPEAPRRVLTERGASY